MIARRSRPRSSRKRLVFPALLWSLLGISLNALAPLQSATAAESALASASCAAVVVDSGEGPADEMRASEAAALGVLIESALKSGTRFRFVDLAAVADRPGSQARAEKAKAAAEALSLARKAYDALDADTAFAEARRAIFLAAESPLAERRAALTAALLLAGAARFYRGDEAGAREELVRLFAIDPTAVLNPADWSPEVIALAESERARGAAERRGEATVRSEPVQTRIYIDGIYTGVTPLLVRDLGPGPHNLSAVAAGYSQRDALLAPGVDQLLHLELSSYGRGLLALEKELAAAFDAKEGDEALRQIGRDAGVDQMIAARVEVHGPVHTARLLRLQVADGKRLGQASGQIWLGGPTGLAAADALVRSALGP